jgi:hypothetical protein
MALVIHQEKERIIIQWEWKLIKTILNFFVH